ncbi:MAG: AbrB/MazE/SpoVT family DNA-binding domain-containing protein [Prevotellaceae bacterium]|jgi:antitoxin MazE|nr:AbrB/MazE/SpoVT family DNA-binding domain-containing protein [Prevotellaceae bacterium]
MTYLLELEITNKPASFVEDFFKSVAFVKTVRMVPNPATKRAHPRQHWAEAAKQMHLSNQDTLLLPDAFNDEKLDWWTWEE